MSVVKEKVLEEMLKLLWLSKFTFKMLAWNTCSLDKGHQVKLY